MESIVWKKNHQKVNVQRIFSFANTSYPLLRTRLINQCERKKKPIRNFPDIERHTPEVFFSHALRPETIANAIETESQHYRNIKETKIRERENQKRRFGIDQSAPTAQPRWHQRVTIYLVIGTSPVRGENGWEMGWIFQPSPPNPPLSVYVKGSQYKRGWISWCVCVCTICTLSRVDSDRFNLTRV